MKQIYKILGISFGLLFFTTVFAAEYGGIGGRPANPDENVPNSQSWFIYTLNPGETKEDTLVVQNNTDETVDVVLYPADSTPSTDGGFALKQMVEPKVAVGKWVTLSQEKLTLEPRSTTNVPFTITVPNDPQLDVGEHRGGILIQKADAEEGGAGGLQLFTRVGVRIYVTIPGERIEKVDIESFDFTLDKTTNTYVARTTVKNTGNVSQNVVIRTRVSSAMAWQSRLPGVLKTFPLEDSKSLQALRDDTLTSNFEFPKPFFGKLKLESFVEFGDGKKTLEADTLEFWVPMDRAVLVMVISSVIFVIAIILLVVIKLRRRGSTKPRSYGRKK